jgi:hypothetical protein
MRLNRRQILKSLSICAAGGATGLGTMLSSRRGFAQTREPKFLIVVAGAGGASIIDSFLAIRTSEAGAAGAGLNVFPDQEVASIADSPLRAVNLSRQSVGAIPIPFTSNQEAFVNKHKNDLMVVTQTGTSVNHTVAQKRSLTGNDAWNGRTMQEAVAAYYGMGAPIPNVNMAAGGYIEPGIDRSIPAFARAEPVAQAALWPLSLDGNRGFKGAPPEQVVQLARSVRDTKLEPESGFVKTFNKSERLQHWMRQREAQPNLQALDLITKLNVFPDAPPQLPLTEYGLAQSPDGQAVLSAFPSLLTDPLEAQAALAFLLIKHRVSVTVTIAPSFNVLLDLDGFPPMVTNPPLAFDFSHQSHRAAQAVMWGRILGMADRLSDLLKSVEYANGESFWDRTMIFFASDFGRTKRRPANADDFGTSHDLNNGYAILSPLANGNRVLGGVDPTTALTYGFDPETGAPDTGRTMQEREIYAGILHAMGVDTAGSGLADMRAMRRNA